MLKEMNNTLRKEELKDTYKIITHNNTQFALEDVHTNEKSVLTFICEKSIRQYAERNNLILIN